MTQPGDSLNLSIWVTREERDAISREASKRSMTMNNFLRNAINTYVGRDFLPMKKERSYDRLTNIKSILEKLETRK